MEPSSAAQFSRNLEYFELMLEQWREENKEGLKTLPKGKAKEIPEYEKERNWREM